MKKLQLNKKTVSVLDKKALEQVKGGGDTSDSVSIGNPDTELLSVSSCRRSRSGWNCCSSGPCV